MLRKFAAEQLAQVAEPAPLASPPVAPVKLPQLAHVKESLQVARAADKAAENVKGTSHDEGGDEEAADDNETLRPWANSRQRHANKRLRIELDDCVCCFSLID